MPHREERIKNLELLERVFVECGVKAEVPVAELSKAKFSANHEFLQWAYDFVHRRYPDANFRYRGYARREEARAQQQHGRGAAAAAAGSGHSPAQLRPRRAKGSMEWSLAAPGMKYTGEARTAAGAP